MTRLRTAPLAGLIVIILFGGILVSQALGRWNTTATKQPARYSSGDFAGQANPADIRGSYTWQDVENAFGLPAAAAAVAFSTSGHGFSPIDKINALEEAYAGAVPAGYEIGTDSVRLMAALHAGLPFTPEDGTLLPDAAVALLAARPGVDATAIGRYALSAVSGSAPLRPVVNAASAIVAPVPTIATSPAAAAVAPATATPVVSAPATAPAAQGPALGSQAGNGAALSATGRTLVGKTTFGELYAWGLTEAQVAAVIGYAPGPGSQSVRDSLAAVGLEFSAYKVALQALIDGLAP